MKKRGGRHALTVPTLRDATCRFPSPGFPPDAKRTLSPSFSKSATYRTSPSSPWVTYNKRGVPSRRGREGDRSHACSTQEASTPKAEAWTKFRTRNRRRQQQFSAVHGKIQGDGKPEVSPSAPPENMVTRCYTSAIYRLLKEVVLPPRHYLRSNNCRRRKRIPRHLLRPRLHVRSTFRHRIRSRYR